MRGSRQLWPIGTISQCETLGHLCDRLDYSTLAHQHNARICRDSVLRPTSEVGDWASLAPRRLVAEWTARL